MSRQPRERVFTLSPVEAWLAEHDEKDDDDERRELLTGLLERLRPEVCEEQNWIACRDTFDCIRAAGSWKAFVRRPHVDLFVLRALVVRGRAKTRDAGLRRLVTLPNPVLWRVLNYWRATS